MSEICSKCGLPKEICACQAIEKETAQVIRVYATEKKFKKLVTIVEGLGGEELERVTKELKRKFACGGSCKEGYAVLQGDHADRVVDYLVELGYPKEVIKRG